MRNFTRAIIFIAVIFTSFFYWNHGKESYLFYGDSLGYYSYLPSFFIYDNFYSIQELPKDQGIEQPVLDYVARYKAESAKSPKGIYVNQYTYGVAAFELPFFVIAHIYEKLSGGRANGYSLVYHHTLKLGFLIYGLLGLFLLYRVVCKFFDSGVSALSVVFLLIGTNLFWFIFFQGGMAHTILFTLYAALIYCTILLHEKPERRLYYLLVGIIAGSITVIRPTDVLCLAIPFLYNVSSFETLKVKLKLLKANYLNLLFASTVFMMPIIPQLFFWKKYAGSFIYYSYNGQSFDWLNPRIIDGIFGFRNGWLAYSPIIIFCLLGLFLFKRIRPINLIIWIILPIFIYITYSWWCWNYINGYGSRPMIHMYPLLIFPLAALLEYVIRKGKIIRITGLAILVFLSLINSNLIMKVVEGKANTAESNKAFYYSTLFRNKLNYNDLVSLETAQIQPDSTAIKKMELLRYTNFEELVDSNYYVFDYQLESKVYRYGAGQEYAHISFRDTLAKEVNADYIKCEAMIRMPQLAGGVWQQPKLTISCRRNDNTIFWQGVTLNNKIGWGENYCTHKQLTLGHRHENKWGRVSFFVRLDNIELKAGDIIDSGIWNMAKKELYMDDLSVSFWNEK